MNDFEERLARTRIDVTRRFVEELELTKKKAHETADGHRLIVLDETGYGLSFPISEKEDDELMRRAASLVNAVAMPLICAFVRSFAVILEGIPERRSEQILGLFQESLFDYVVHLETLEGMVEPVANETGAGDVVFSENSLDA